jgi:hypothetical protein
MKKYEIKIYRGNRFYPLGGYHDYVGSLFFCDIEKLDDQIEKAKKLIESTSGKNEDGSGEEWAQLVFPLSIMWEGTMENGENWIWEKV